MPSLKKNLVYNFLLSCSQLLLPLISIPYLSRVLHPAGIGKVSFIDSFTYYFITVAEFGIMVYGMREVARVRDDKEERKKLVSELVSLHLVSSFFTLILYFIAVFFVWNKINDVRLLLFSLSFLLVNFFSCEWYFLGMEEFKYITLRSLITRLAGLISIFILIKHPGDYYIYYAIIVLSAIANSIWNNILLFRELPISFKKVNWKKHIRYTWVTYLISIVSSITLLLDNVLLRLMSTADAVGLYAFAIKMAKVSSILMTDTLLVFFPRIVLLLKQENKNELRTVVLRNIQLLILFSLPICAGLFLLSDQLIIIFLGNGFLPAITDLKILAVYPFLKSYNLFLSKQVLIPHNKEKIYLKTLTITGVIFIILSLFLSYHFADKGACYAIVLSEGIGLLLNYYYAKKINDYLKIFDWKSFFHALAGIIIFIPVIYLLKKIILSGILTLILSVTVCFLVYIFTEVFIIRNEFMKFLKNIFFQYFADIKKEKK
ncbi:MAG TPA: flippase [Puia sp.]|nr:flippase [Puia sp.]